MKLNFFEKKPENKESKPFKYKAFVGDDIQKTFKEMVKISKEKNVDVVCDDFNGRKLEVLKDSNITPEELYGDFLEKENEERVKYHNSQEYKDKLKKDKEELVQKQAEMDKLEKELSSMDFNNQVVLLDWLCKFEKTNWRGVESNEDNDVLVFNKNGYRISTGALDQKFIHDKDKLARHIIGQALYGMCRHGGPNQVIHEHVKQWKKEFGNK